MTRNDFLHLSFLHESFLTFKFPSFPFLQYSHQKENSCKSFETFLIKNLYPKPMKSASTLDPLQPIPHRKRYGHKVSPLTLPHDESLRRFLHLIQPRPGSWERESGDVCRWEGVRWWWELSQYCTKKSYVFFSLLLLCKTIRHPLFSIFWTIFALYECYFCMSSDEVTMICAWCSDISCARTMVMSQFGKCNGSTKKVL